MPKRDYTELGYRVGSARLGIDPSEYRAKREAGLRWCSHHVAWEPAETFRSYPSNPLFYRSYCVEAERDRARTWQRRKRAGMREAS